MFLRLRNSSSQCEKRLECRRRKLGAKASPPPHGGLRPVHRKSTGLKQLSLGSYVVQIWSSYVQNLSTGNPQTLSFGSSQKRDLACLWEERNFVTVCGRVRKKISAQLHLQGWKDFHLKNRTRQGLRLALMVVLYVPRKGCCLLWRRWATRWATTSRV